VPTAYVRRLKTPRPRETSPSKRTKTSTPEKNVRRPKRLAEPDLYDSGRNENNTHIADVVTGFDLRLEDDRGGRRFLVSLVQSLWGGILIMWSGSRRQRRRDMSAMSRGRLDAELQAIRGIPPRRNMAAASVVSCASSTPRYLRSSSGQDRCVLNSVSRSQ